MAIESTTAGSDRFFFMHVRKTAGTSLRNLLDEMFPRGEVCPAFDWKDLNAIPQEKLSAFRLFRGHLAGDLARYVGAPLREFSFLRDPVDRAYSQYTHVVRAADQKLHARMRRLGSIEACLQDEECQPWFYNFQAAVLADAKIPGEPGHDQGWRREISEDELLARAKRRVDRMEFVGTAEQFAESVELLCHVFEWDLPLRYMRENVNPGWNRNRGLTEKGRELLMAGNRVDFALYAYVKQRLDTQLQAMRAHQKANPELWKKRAELRLEKLHDMAGRQWMLIAEYEQERATIAVRFGLLLNRWLNRFMPHGTRRRMAAQALVRGIRRLLWGTN